jgi:hypothetical protein
MKTINKNTKNVEIEFTPEIEDISPYDHLEKEDADNVCKEAEWNEYAWFCAKVEVTYNNLEATEYLGGCSYKSENDFKENSGYYEDMVQTCIDEINKEITVINQDIQKRWEIRKAKRIAEKYGLMICTKI